MVLRAVNHDYIPGTNVDTSSENKEIVDFLNKYKAAVEKRSVDAIDGIFVAKDFKDNMGSEDPKDYMDYLTLKEKLEKTLPLIKDMRLGMFIQRIAKIEKDTYEVVFYFHKQILTAVPSGEKWISIKEVNRMVIRRIHDKNKPYKFEILQGI